MPTLITDGSTTTDGTEQTLATDTANHTYVFVIDTNLMANGDQIEIKLKTIVRSAGTERIAYYCLYANVQGEPQKYSMPVPANISFKVTLKRVAGSDHAYPWALLAL